MKWSPTTRGSVWELLFGYTGDEVARYRSIRDSYRAGRAAHRGNRQSSLFGAARGGFADGLQAVSALVPTSAVRRTLDQPDLRPYSSRHDLRAARIEMRTSRDSRVQLLRGRRESPRA